jgi:hypothetical protein
MQYIVETLHPLRLHALPSKKQEYLYLLRAVALSLINASTVIKCVTKSPDLMGM